MPGEFSSSILGVTGKSNIQLSKFYSIKRALEPHIPGSNYINESE